MIGPSKIIRKCLKTQGFTEREMHNQSITVTHVKDSILLKYHGSIKPLQKDKNLGSTQISQVYIVTYLNKIPHVYQVCLISCTTGIWRSPQVRLNLVTSQLHETWASQVHAVHSQVNSKCTKYKLLSTSTIRFATQNIITFVFHIHGWFLKNLTSKKEGSPPLRLDWCYLKKYWNTKFQLIQRHK